MLGGDARLPRPTLSPQIVLVAFDLLLVARAVLCPIVALMQVRHAASVRVYALINPDLPALFEVWAALEAQKHMMRSFGVLMPT